MKGKIKGFVNIQRGDEKTRVPGEELDKYLAEGWVRGWKLPKLINVTKGGVDKRVYPEELDKYLAEGWVRGRYYKHSEETKRRLSKANKGKPKPRS